MTCFSIQKTLKIAALLVLAGFASAGPAFSQKEPTARLAQEMDERETLRREKISAPIVVELYTAADCAACVLADRILYDAMKDRQVIALSCLVNDIRESEEPAAAQEDKPMDPCTFRQWTYTSGRSSQDVTVRVPTFFVNGNDSIDAADLGSLTATLNRYHYAASNKAVEAMLLWKDDDTVSIHLPASNEKYKPNASVWLIRYKDMAVQKIDSGINKGRVLRFSNIMQDVKHVGKWRGEPRTIDVDVPKPQGGKERGGYVVLAAEMMGTPVLVAGRLEDYPHPNDLKRPKQEAPSGAAPALPAR